MPVSQRGSSWQAAVSHKGRRYRKDWPTKREAELWEAQVKADLLAGKEPILAQSQVKGAATLGDMLRVVSDTHWNNTRSAQVLTFNGQECVSFLGADLPVSRVDPQAIAALVARLKAKGNSNATVNRKLAALSKILTVSEEHGHLIKKPKIPRLKEMSGRLEYWTVEMERLALDWCRQFGRDDLADYIGASIDTGLRQGEMLRVTKRDIDWTQTPPILTVWIAKSNKPRSVPLTRRAAEILKRRTHSDTPKAFDMTQWQIRHQWDQMLEGLGEEASDGMGSPHTLRHTFGSRLAQRGVPMREIQELMGHSSLQVTMRYAKLAPRNLTAAIAALEQ